MGLFDRLMSGGSAADNSKVNWTALTSIDQLDTIVTESKEQTIAVFKHSTRCGISRMVLKGFENDFDLENDQVKLYFLDLLNNRDISNEIASRFNVWHESPQLLVFSKGKIVYHTSHSNIQADKLKELI